MANEKINKDLNVSIQFTTFSRTETTYLPCHLHRLDHLYRCFSSGGPSEIGGPGEIGGPAYK